MDLNYGGKLKEFRTRCEQAGLTIAYDAELEVPYAAINNYGQTSIHLPMPSPEWNEREWIGWEYMAEHELGHLMPKCIDAYDVLRETKIAPGSFIGSMQNLLEDNRQEWTDYYVMEGRRQRLNKGRNQFLGGQDTTMLGKGEDEKMHAFQSMYTWDTMIRESWMPALIGQADRMLEHMTEQQLGWIEKLQAGDYESTLKSGLTAHELYDLNKRIIDEVFEFNSEQEEQDAQAEQEKGKGEEGEDGDSSGEGSGEGDSAEGSGATEEEEARAQCGGVVKYSDLLAHAHDSPEDHGATYHPLHIEYDTDEAQAFYPCDVKDYELLDYVNGDETGSTSGGYYSSMTKPVGSGLAKHVRRLLQVRSASRYQHGLKRGKISPKSIYRAGAVGHNMENRVFKKKLDNDILNTAVFVLCDMSGSMGGDKVINAGISCKLLNEAISTIHIPLEIVGFDFSYTAPRHALWKGFDKPVNSDELVSRVVDSTDQMMSGNSDGESILWAYQRLIKRKEKRKLLIVLSDGSPAGGRGDTAAHTSDVINSIQETGAVELYGIGIEDHNVERFYKDRAVINHASELEGALLKVIEKKILN